MTTPLVTVVIPCFNHGRFVAEAFESVRAQTWSRWEAIVVDDGSSDDTPAILDALVARCADPRLTVHRQPNRGLSAARNAGLAAGAGEFFVPLDADDRLRPRMIEACMARLQAEPDLAFAYGHLQTFGDDPRVVRYPPYNLHRLLDENQVTVCALVRKSAWATVGGYKPAMIHGAEDWEFWLACAENDLYGARIDEVLFEYRRQGTSMWTETEKKLDVIKAQLEELHPDLYSVAGRARIRAQWHRALDPHAKDSWFVRAAGALPPPLRRMAERLYRRFVL